MIKNEEYEKIGEFEQDLVRAAAQEIFYDDGSFHSNLQHLDCLSLIDENKIEIARLSQIYQTGISDEDLKTIFNFEMLTKKIDAQDEEIHKIVFDEIAPVLS